MPLETGAENRIKFIGTAGMGGKVIEAGPSEGWPAFLIIVAGAQISPGECSAVRSDP